VPILHIDIDPMVIGANYLTEVGMVGDARLALEALGAEVAERLAHRPADAVDGAVLAGRAKAARQAQLEPLATSLDAPIRPERVVQSLNRLLPDDAVVCADPGTPCPYFSAYYDVSRPGRHFITNRAHGALGFSMSAALGAWVGRPQSKCVSVMGDGSFGFTVGELETIVRHKAPLLLVVFSNSVYGWIKASQKAGYDKRYYSVDFERTDHARIAEAYGVKAWRVEDPAKLDAAIKAAMEHDGPALIDVVAQPLQDAAAPVSQWMG
jgi:acetolactate synthase-1/2/3 large subunit